MRRPLHRRPALKDGYIYIHESDLNIGQFNDPNSVDEAVFCPYNDNWLMAMQEGLKSIHDNDV